MTARRGSRRAVGQLGAGAPPVGRRGQRAGCRGVADGRPHDGSTRRGRVHRSSPSPKCLVSAGRPLAAAGSRSRAGTGARSTGLRAGTSVPDRPAGPSIDRRSGRLVRRLDTAPGVHVAEQFGRRGAQRDRKRVQSRQRRKPVASLEIAQVRLGYPGELGELGQLQAGLSAALAQPGSQQQPASRPAGLIWSGHAVTLACPGPTSPRGSRLTLATAQRLGPSRASCSSAAGSGS